MFSCLEKKLFRHLQQLRVFWGSILSNWDLSISPSKGSLQVDSMGMCFQHILYSNLLLPNSTQFLLWCSQFQKTVLLRPEIAAHLAPFTPFHIKDNVTPNLYLQLLKISHRPFGKFIVVLKRLVFFIQWTPLQKPARYLSAIWSLCIHQAEMSRFPPLSLLCRRQIRLGEK